MGLCLGPAVPWCTGSCIIGLADGNGFNETFESGTALLLAGKFGNRDGWVVSLSSFASGSVCLSSSLLGSRSLLPMMFLWNSDFFLVSSLFLTTLEMMDFWRAGKLGSLCVVRSRMAWLLAVVLSLSACPLAVGLLLAVGLTVLPLVGGATVVVVVVVISINGLLI